MPTATMEKVRVLVDVVVVMDRSGSMTTVASEMSGALNQLVKDQKKEAGDKEVRFTLAKFDNKYELEHSLTPIDKVGPIKLSPRGATALYDAIGRTVAHIRDAWKKENKRLGKPEEHRVVLTIVTDGYENASQEYDAAGVKKLLEQCEKDGWALMFLGANQDAIESARTIGISGQNAMSYNSNSNSVASISQAMSSNNAAYTSTGDTKRARFSAAQRSAADVQ